VFAVIRSIVWSACSRREGATAAESRAADGEERWLLAVELLSMNSGLEPSAIRQQAPTCCSNCLVALGKNHEPGSWAGIRVAAIRALDCLEDSQMVSKRKFRPMRRKRTRAIADRGVYGEGSYEGTRTYNAATRRFVTSGRVDEAARDAAPRDADEARSIAEAEQVGARRAKGEDPAVRRGGRARGKRPA
jgi:hypothetical protein